MSYLFGVQSLPVTGDISLATSVPTGTGAAARSLRSHFGDVIWAADFGVQSNGSTDDTIAWGNALNAASGTGKNIVMAPAGVSIISSITIPTGVTVIGVSPPNSYSGNNTLTTMLGSVLKKGSGTNPMVTMSGATVGVDDRGSGLANMSLIGDGTRTGIVCPVAIPFHFHRLFVAQCGTGIDGTYGTIFVDDCVFAYNTIGIHNITDSRIVNCGFNGNGNGIQLDNGANDNTIAHCKIEFNTGNGVQVNTTEDNVIIGNNFDSSGTHNLSWTSNRNGVISGNVFRNQADSNTMSGNHLFLSGNTDTTVTGNTTKFDGSVGTTPVNAVGGSTNTSVIMFGNTWKGHSGGTSINASVTNLNPSLAALGSCNIANGLTFNPNVSPTVNPNVSFVTAAGTYTVLSNDSVVIINKTVAAASNVTLNSNPPTGQWLTIKDGKGDANVNHIVITPAAGTIDGSATYTLLNPYAAVMLVSTGSGNWSVI